MPRRADLYKEFCGHMDGLSRRHDVGRVFDDFLTMGVCSFHQLNIASRAQEQDPDNEKLYMEAIKRYKRPELDVFAKLLACVQLYAYQNPYGDLLGQYFTEYITRGHNGQFFTPTTLAVMMAQLTADNDNPPEGKTVYDPACGSGRLILEWAKVAPNNYFFANDVSRSCAKMTAINGFLNGLRCEVAWMNTLSMEFYGAWKINVPTLGIVPIDKEQSHIWTAPPIRKAPTLPDQPLFFGDQLSLF